MLSRLIVFFLTWCTLIADQGRQFYLRMDPSLGPGRLDMGWIDRSVMSCMASCVRRFESQCQSVLYNNVSQLCTPGGWLNKTEALPSESEGDLYVGYNCDERLNFSLYTHNTTRVCLMYDTQKRTHESAEELCSSSGSHLFTLRTYDRFKMLQNLVIFHAWVGLDDLEWEGRYVWVDNKEVISDTWLRTIYKPNQPDDGDGIEDCTIMIRNLKLLNDYQCNETAHTVCEAIM